MALNNRCKLFTSYFILLSAAFSIFIINSCTSTKSLQQNSISSLTIISRSGWNAAEPREYKQHTPVRITVHHEGTKLEKGDDAAKKLYNIQRWGMGPDRNWTDIPYHFLIAPDGTIYEGRAVTTVGETGTEYDPTGHFLICCLGNLEVQELPEEQKNSLIRLIAWGSKKYNIPLSTLGGHKDYSAKTNCPGKNLYPLVKDGTLMREAEKLLK